MLWKCKIKNDFKWYWCPTCQAAMLACSKTECMGTSCNSAGCSECDNYFERGNEMRKSGLAPKTKEECHKNAS